MCGSLFLLYEAQIADDGEQSLSDGRFGIAGKIEKGIKFSLVRFHLRYNSFWNFLFVLRARGKSRKRGLVAAAPNRHFGAVVTKARISSVNHLIDRAGIKPSVISLGQHRQIGGLYVELGALRTRAFGI